MKKFLAVILTLVMVLSLALIPASAQSDEVRDEIFSVIKEGIQSVEITEDDVHFEYIKELTNNKFLVRYTVRQFGYPGDMPHLDIGRYIFISSRPLPQVYHRGELYEVEYAYDRGWLSLEDLELMDSFSELYFEKTKISHDLDVESRYGDPEEYVNVRFEVNGFDMDVTDIENWEDDISGAYDELEEYFDAIHYRLVNHTLENFDHKDIHHSQGISVVAVKRKDIKKIAEDSFVEYMSYLTNVHTKFIEIYTPYMKEYTFEEICWGYDENDDESYVLIKAYGGSAKDMVIGFRYGDIVVDSSAIYGPFPFKYGIYDIKEDKVYDIFDLRDTPDKYYGLQEDLIEYASAYRVGDRDRDGVVSVMDATGIQMMLAGIKGDVYDDYFCAPKSGGSGYITDFDNDGEVTVMDATAIQLSLAQMN